MSGLETEPINKLLVSVLPISSYKRRLAFTLAEVLITLLIIGVVASLVIPSLLNDTQNQESYTLLKKDFSTLSDAAKMMMIDNGGNMAGLFNSSTDMMNKFGNYMVFTKTCNAGIQGCFYDGTNSWKTLHGDNGWFNPTDYATAITNNGGLIRFAFDNQDCAANYGANPSPANKTCGWVRIDVNGFKGPNVLGKDLYDIWVTKNGVYPFGTQNDGQGTCDKNYSGMTSGRGCAAVILSGDTVN